MRAGFWPGTSAGGIHASVRCVSAIAARSTGVTMDHGAIRNSPHGTVRLNQGDDMIAPSIVEEVYAVALLGPAARASARRRVYPAAAILGDIECATAWSQYPPARVIAAGPPVFSLVPAFSVIDGLLGGSRLSAPEAMQLLKTAGSRITSSHGLWPYRRQVSLGMVAAGVTQRPAPTCDRTPRAQYVSLSWLSVRIWRIVRNAESLKFLVPNTRQWCESHPLRQYNPVSN